MGTKIEYAFHQTLFPRAIEEAGYETSEGLAYETKLSLPVGQPLQTHTHSEATGPPESSINLAEKH